MHEKYNCLSSLCVVFVSPCDVLFTCVCSSALYRPLITPYLCMTMLSNKPSMYLHIKGAMCCLRSRISLVNICDFFGAKDLLLMQETCVISHTTRMSKYSYARIRLRKETHTLWIEMKRSLGLKSDDALACHLLNTTTTVSNRRNYMEANDVI